jgi:replicative DNA helicase
MADIPRTATEPRPSAANGKHPGEEPLPRVLPLSYLLEEWGQDAERRHRAHISDTPIGAITGLPKLDTELGGALEPGLHILHAEPGAGKTALALHIAAHCGCPCLFVTCEMAPLELLRRITARVTSTFLGRLKSGELTPEESLALARRGVAAAANVTLLDATPAPARPKWLQNAAWGVRGKAEHFLVIVDSVHAWAEGWAGDAAEYDSLNAGLAWLRSLSAILNCPIVGVAERNRAAMKSGGLSAGAGSRKFEYGAQSLWSLSRDPDVREDAAGEVRVTLKLEKNRNGAPGRKVDLCFHGALQQFREA